jgi:hypothetical protein
MKEMLTVSEVARLWGLSDDIIRRLFEKEPDVLILEGEPKSSRRAYRTMRIPSFVVERVYRRLAVQRENISAA